MSRIRILPEILSNKIAAGEVVERPASVVKELLENAIDAESTRIAVEIRQGGRSLIRVSDNGSGMSRDDAMLCLERYATSKIHSDPDLYSISTLGFRGEALPSIAAVSRFTLTTNDQNGTAATRIFVEGGKIKDVKETGAPRGTMVEAAQLFFNTPARRKYVKTVNTEMGHIAEVVSAIALAWNSIQFRLSHNDRPVRNWPAAGAVYDRVVDVLGPDLRNRLIPVSYEGEALSVSGWISDPAITRSSAQKLYIYVNGRCIRDRGAVYAVLDGYRGRIMKGRFPLGALFLRIPPAEVDVNVHPAKQEIRFARQQDVYQAVRRAVSDAFSRPAQPVRPPGMVQDPQTAYEGADSQEGGAPQEETENQTTARSAAPERQIRSGAHQAAFAAFPAQAGPPERRQAPEETKEQEKQQVLWQPPAFSGMSIIGQFRNTYIICEAEDGLFLIDQHAAHERIVYERLRKERRERVQVQDLVLPETIELGYRESAAVSELIPDLAAVGIGIEPFGGRTFIVKSLPAVLSDQSARALITEIAETAAGAGYTPGLSETMEKCLILMACHGAIRANQALSEKEMRALLSQLDQCENPYHCPHGRPTLVRWTLAALEKQFRRIV
jgi:DNA mismatch repair protein MutL